MHRGTLDKIKEYINQERETGFRYGSKYKSRDLVASFCLATATPQPLFYIYKIVARKNGVEVQYIKGLPEFNGYITNADGTGF